MEARVNLRNRYRPDQIYLFHSIWISAAFSLVWTVNQIYRVQTVGLNPLQLVLTGTTLELTAFLFEIPTGVLADVYSRRLSTIVGVALIGFSFWIEGLFPFFRIVLFAQVVWGLGWTFISGAHDAWIADEIGADQAAPLYLRATSLGLLGNLLAIPVSVGLAQFGLNLPFLVGGTLCFLLAVLLSIVMPEIGFQSRAGKEHLGWSSLKETLSQSLGLVRIKPRLLAFLGAAIFIGLYSEGFDRLTEAHFLANFEFPALPLIDVVVWFGLIRAGRILLSVGATEGARRRLQLNDDRVLVLALQISYGLVALGILVFAQTRSFWIALIATWLVHSLRALAGPLKTAWINQHIDSRVRATVLSTASQMDALGQMIGGPIVGVVGTLRSIRAALTTSALMLFPALPLFQKMRGPDESSPQDIETS
jgi:DHA3 family tetracycline resistance protein-like MFS transporter